MCERETTHENGDRDRNQQRKLPSGLINRG